MSQDQPDNAARIQKLGVGRVLLPQKFTPRNISAALKHLLHNPETKQSCKTLAQKNDFNQALKNTCDHLQKLIEQNRN
jgi:UDP:flavonoid glycosyltransferase YjiC (YdhE family)